MVPRFQMSLTLAFLAVVSLCMHMIDGCSPPEPGFEMPETFEYKMMSSHVVAQGYTRHRHRDNSFPHDDVYIVDFEIRCIFKGAPLPEMIRIYEVGSIGGLCLSTEMPENKSLLVYLRRKDDGKFVPAYHEDPGSSQYLEEVVGLCETKIAYPEGRSKTNNKEVCPDPYPYEDCMPIPTTKTFPGETTVVFEMDPTGTRNNNDNNSGGNNNGNSDNTNKAMDPPPMDNNNNKEKDTGKNGDGGEASYESVRTSGGGSNGGAVDTSDTSDKTGNKEGENGFDPDGSMATLTFNLLVPLAMLTVWFVLV